MAMRNMWALGAAVTLATLLAGCDTKPAATGTAAQGAEPEGTISDELPDMNLLPNDAPLADPADQGIVPGVGAAPAVPSEAAAEASASPQAAPAAPPPVERSDDSVGE